MRSQILMLPGSVLLDPVFYQQHNNCCLESPVENIVMYCVFVPIRFLPPVNRRLVVACSLFGGR